MRSTSFDSLRHEAEIWDARLGQEPSRYPGLSRPGRAAEQIEHHYSPLCSLARDRQIPVLRREINSVANCLLGRG